MRNDRRESDPNAYVEARPKADQGKRDKD
jgi:hypothetical protein